MRDDFLTIRSNSRRLLLLQRNTLVTVLQIWKPIQCEKPTAILRWEKVQKENQ